MKIAKKATTAVLSTALAASMACIAPALASAAPTNDAPAVISAAYTALAAKTAKHTCTVGDKHPLAFKANGKKIKGSKVTWKSSNKKIASINKKGVVTAKKAGKVTITGKYKGATVKYKVTVKPAQVVDPAEVEFNNAAAEMKEMLKKYGTSSVENGQTVWRGSDKAEDEGPGDLPVTFEYNEATRLFTVSVSYSLPANAGDKSGTYAIKFVFSDNYAEKDCVISSYKDNEQVAVDTMKKSEFNTNNIPDLAGDSNSILYDLILEASINQAAQNQTGIANLKKFGFTTIDDEYDQPAAEFNSTVNTFKAAIVQVQPVVENGQIIYRIPSNNSGKYEGITASYGYNATKHEFFVKINIGYEDSSDAFSTELTYGDSYADKNCSLTSYRNGKQVKSVTMKKSDLNKSTVPVLSDDGQEVMAYGVVLTGMVNQIANNPVATTMFKTLGFSTIDSIKDESEQAFDTMANGLKEELKAAGPIIEGEQNIYGIITTKEESIGTITTSQEYNETTGQFAISVSIDARGADSSYTVRLTFSDKYADEECLVIASKDAEQVGGLSMKKSEFKVSDVPSLSDNAEDKPAFKLLEETAKDYLKGNIITAGILVNLGFTSIGE